MKDYVKAVLYAYPLLKTVEKDYEEHITNKALLSYMPRSSAESTIEKIAEEIVEMRSLEWLKGRVEEVLETLTESERNLLATRYFGKRKKAAEKDGLTERTYFRRQGRLGERVGALLSLGGLTEEVYLREYAQMDIFLRVEGYLARKKDFEEKVGKKKGRR